MKNHMNQDNNNDITQKDLLKLLFDQAQHNATREELMALENRTNQRFDKIDERFEKLEAKFDKKFDRMNWLLVTTLVGVIASLAIQVFK
ncbi:Hemolysin XhlA [Vibrio crassostreae]|nr:Hemolysin XhlA [Vibrio crassostreae]CAK2115427.1 Hemolysin XhlA [Vibrio crassostreae]CAK2115659.1 Hemolysin XhlA [Vibrio crassostreae]CAK2115892.1 Hemolysin XhlA [Vibrio crassostreae]CAK2364966.1 Hemolysin XhlA [Vibrio crassostreae]